MNTIKKIIFDLVCLIWKLVKLTVFVLLGLLLALVFAWFWVKETPPTSYEKLDQVDQAMFIELNDIYSRFEATPEALWNREFDFQNRPLILARSNVDKGAIWRYAYIINDKQLAYKMGAQKVSFSENLSHLQEVYATRSLGVYGVPLWFPGNFNPLDFEGDTLLAFKYYPDYFLDEIETEMSFNTFLVHEAFHTEHQKYWVYDFHGADSIMHYPYTKEHFELLKKEYALLDQAFMEPERQAKIDILIKWVAVREDRYQTWPELENETLSEAIEGTAEYTSFRLQHQKYYKNFSALRAAQDPENRPPEGVLLSHILNETILPNQEMHYLLARTMSYYKGVLMGYIMDELEVDWKEMIKDNSVDRGKTQFEILREFVQS